MGHSPRKRGKKEEERKEEKEEIKERKKQAEERILFLGLGLGKKIKYNIVTQKLEFRLG